MKNSSRLVPTIDRNFTRSSSGCDASVAWASTRWLNSSQLSSRLMYSAAFFKSLGSICESAVRGGSTRRAGLARVVARDRRSVRWRRSAIAASAGESICDRWREKESRIISDPYDTVEVPDPPSTGRKTLQDECRTETAVWPAYLVEMTRLSRPLGNRCRTIRAVHAIETARLKSGVDT